MHLITTRFNNDTWTENIKYRQVYNTPCIYGSPQELNSNKIQYQTSIFVIEMNNTTNQIEGIGLIKNFNHTDKYYLIHSDYNYNRYIYKSNYRLDRTHFLSTHKVLLTTLE